MRTREDTWQDMQQGERLAHHLALVQKLSPLWRESHTHDQDALRAFCILLAHHKSDAVPLDLLPRPPWTSLTAQKDKRHMLKQNGKDWELSLNRMLHRVTLF